MQEFKNHNPKDGIYGDCARACIASLLEVPIKDVPNFGIYYNDGELFNQAIDDYLKLYGIKQFHVIYETTKLETLMDAIAHINPNCYYLLAGKSRSECNHFVICLNNKIVHDPVGSGIVGPCLDGFYWITVFVPLSMVKM